jgi:cell division protein ZipA
MGLRELLILVLILAIVAVILRGLYVALRARRGQLRMALEKNVPQYDPEELVLSELPNGGARLVERSFAQVVKQNSEFSARDRLNNGKTDQAIPVLMDTVGDEEDDEEPVSRPSSVASARQAVRARHIMGSGAPRPVPKPVFRPIDRPAQTEVAANLSRADMDDREDEDFLYPDPLDSHVFGTDRYETEADSKSTFADETSEYSHYDDDEGGSHDDDLDPDELDYEDQDAEPDDEDDFDDFDEDDEDEDQNSRYDDSDADDLYDEDDDEDDFDDEYPDEEADYEAESFDSVYADEPLNQTTRDSRSDSYASDAAMDTDDGWDDEPDPEQTEQHHAPRRWWHWAGDKLSGMGTGGDAAEPAKQTQEGASDRQDRAEPTIGSNAFVDSFEEARTVSPEPVSSRTREPLDKSRQNELSLDEPEEISLQRVQAPPVRTPAPKQERVEEPSPASGQERKADSSPAPVVQDYSEVLILNVVAKPGREFSGVELLQVLLGNGLRFGDMSIFHLHVDTDVRSPVVFSVANIVNPGTFDLNAINDFSTRGLCFFMTLPNVANSMQAFERMLDAAQAVRVALDGDLKDDNRSVMTAQTIEHYRQRVRDFDLRQLRQHK